MRRDLQTLTTRILGISKIGRAINHLAIIKEPTISSMTGAEVKGIIRVGGRFLALEMLSLSHCV
jgi:hypothetical protein